MTFVIVLLWSCNSVMYQSTFPASIKTQKDPDITCDIVSNEMFGHKVLNCV